MPISSLPNHTTMKILDSKLSPARTLAPVLALAAIVLIGSGCSSSGTNKGTVSTAAIGALGAYGAGALPAREFADSSGSGFIVSEHSKNRR